MKIESCGKFIGNYNYWKLYFVENIFRIITHTILSVQLGPDWWDKAVDDKIKNKVEDFKREYIKRPWHTKPGPHDIYYVQLWMLNEIMRANSHILSDAIPDIDEWIARIEQLRLPRNIVGHMNYPNQADRKRINKIYLDSKVLLESLENRLRLKIP